MNRILVALIGIGCFVLALTLFPASASAQNNDRETITATVNVETPGGHRVIGAIVAHRSLGVPVSTSWSFNGMIDGRSVQISGTAFERWIQQGWEEIDSTSVSGIPGSLQDIWETTRLNTSTVKVLQIGPGLASVMDVPLAINNPYMQPPGSGDHHYNITTPGGGRKAIAGLPGSAAAKAASEDSLSQRFARLLERSQRRAGGAE